MHLTNNGVHFSICLISVNFSEAKELRWGMWFLKYNFLKNLKNKHSLSKAKGQLVSFVTQSFFTLLLIPFFKLSISHDWIYRGSDWSSAKLVRAGAVSFLKITGLIFILGRNFHSSKKNCHCQMVMETLLQQVNVNKDALSKANCCHSNKMLSIFK